MLRSDWTPSRVSRKKKSKRASRSTSPGTPPTNTVDNEAIKGSSGGDSSTSSDLISASKWLRKISKRALDREFLQPLYLTEEQQVSIKANTKSLYGTLKPWQTRLLTLLPGEPKSSLKCNLIAVDVIDGDGLGIVETSQIAKFEALSYSWGYPEPVCLMICNGLTVGIPKELATALQYLRSRRADRHIWVDAICINQDDLIEKAHQVRNMLRIFEKATSVIAWLGPNTSSSGRLFDALQPGKAQKYQIDRKKLDSKDKAVADDITAALTTHLESAWFVRTWIRQEVFASKKLKLQFGQYHLDFEEFLAGVFRLRGVFKYCLITVPSTLEVYQSEYQHCGTDRQDFRFQGELPGYVSHWIKILRLGTLFKVSDERDRIYGALGLLTSPSVRLFAHLPASLDTLAAGFPVDYNKTVSEVYEDVTKFLINMSGRLEVLDVFRDRRYLKFSKMPSWGTEWGLDRVEFHPLPSIEHQRGVVLQQAYTEKGKLRLKGTRIAGHLTSLDMRKEISHPRDRFEPIYRKPITLQEIMQGPTRQATTSTGTTKEVKNPPYAVIFTRVYESAAAFHLINFPIKSNMLDQDFAAFLAGSTHVFAYIEDHSGKSSFDLEELHFLVPRTASLDDIIVSFYGSKCLHLLRPLFGTPTEYNYLGPIAGIACGEESTKKYTSRPKTLSKVFSKECFHPRETFVLV